MKNQLIQFKVKDIMFVIAAIVFLFAVLLPSAFCDELPTPSVGVLEEAPKTNPDISVQDPTNFTVDYKTEDAEQVAAYVPKVGDLGDTNWMVDQKTISSVDPKDVTFNYDIKDSKENQFTGGKVYFEKVPAVGKLDEEKVKPDVVSSIDPKDINFNFDVKEAPGIFTGNLKDIVVPKRGLDVTVRLKDGEVIVDKPRNKSFSVNDISKLIIEIQKESNRLDAMIQKAKQIQQTPIFKSLPVPKPWEGGATIFMTVTKTETVEKEKPRK